MNNSPVQPRFALLVGAFLSMMPLAAMAADAAQRHPIPGSDFPISAAVEVPAGNTLVYLSGMVPPVADATAPKGSVASYGNTEAQTIAVLKRIDEQLVRLKLSMGDVIKMQVFLVGDPDKAGVMDFAGFMKGYTRFFGTKEQPRLPVRSAFQVAGLAAPGMLVEIEVTAVRQ